MIVLALLVVGFQMVAVYGQDRQGPWDFQHSTLELRASSFMQEEFHHTMHDRFDLAVGLSCLPK